MGFLSASGLQKCARPGRWFFVALLVLGACSILRAENAPATLEFRGQVVVPLRTLTRGQRVSLNLVGVGSPFSAQTWADSKGRFRFRKVLPGTYSLSIHIPGSGEILQTVDVTRSFADARGRVERKFVYDQEALQEQARPLPQGLVSVRELSIPRNARREYQRARDRLRRRDVDGAIQRLEKALELAPQYMEALNNLGILHFQKREYSKAEGYFRKALEQEPEEFEPLLNLGGALLAQGRSEEAVEVNRRAQEARPQDALAIAQLGLSYFLLGDYEQAIVYLEWTEEIDPAHFTHPQISLAKIYLHRSEVEDAVEELEDFLRLHPDSPEASQVRAMLQRIQEVQRAEANERPPL